MNKNKWTKPIDDLISVYGSAEKLAAALNKALGEDGDIITPVRISRIRRGTTITVDHDLGQAILILHVKYVPREDYIPQEGVAGK